MAAVVVLLSLQQMSDLDVAAVVVLLSLLTADDWTWPL